MSSQLLRTLQAELARRLPFCMATLLGTHNSGITIADGYGNRDDHFQEYFKWIKWVVGRFPKALWPQFRCTSPRHPLPCGAPSRPDKLAEFSAASRCDRAGLARHDSARERTGFLRGI